MLEPSANYAILNAMKLNSPESLKAADTVFRNYGGSWTAAREAAKRDENGVLVIPRSPNGRNGGGQGGGQVVEGRRKAG